MNETKRTREALGINQVELANLLGVHPTTIYRWEDKHCPREPRRWHRTMLASFGMAAEDRPGIGRQAIECLDAHGIGLALYVLLRAAYGPQLARSDIERGRVSGLTVEQEEEARRALVKKHRRTSPAKD